MTQDEKIRDIIKGMGRTSASTLLAKVKVIDEENATIDVEITEGLLLEGIRLRSIVDGDNGLYVIPKLDTLVLLLRIGHADDFIVIGTEHYEKIIAKGETISMVITQENITFNDNRLDSFIPDINKLTDKLNQLEGEVNDLKQVFRSWTPVIQDGGAALKLGVATWAAIDITETTKDDIKDEKILN